VGGNSSVSYSSLFADSRFHFLFYSFFTFCANLDTTCFQVILNFLMFFHFATERGCKSQNTTKACHVHLNCIVGSEKTKRKLRRVRS